MQNSQNSEERRPKGKTRKHEKGEKKLEEVICKQDAALFEVNPCRRPLLEPPTQKSTELPWQIKRESQINNHCNLNQLAQCIRNRGGRSHTTTIDLRWSSFREISSSFVGALPEVREPRFGTLLLSASLFSWRELLPNAASKQLGHCCRWNLYDF